SEKNFGSPHLGDLTQGLVARLDWINTQVALAVANQVAVEVVPVGLGKPRPGVNVGDNLAHSSAPFKNHASQSGHEPTSDARAPGKGRLQSFRTLRDECALESS